MAEDGRAVDDLVAVVAALKAELADVRSTLLVRASTRPTGTMEDTLAATPPTGTLLLQGQTLSRVTYAALWKWVGDHAAAGFGPGDGSTTFVLPDMRGRILIAAGTGAGDTYALGDLDGAATRAITTGNLPAHDHNVAIDPIGDHSHGFTTNGSGGHGGHFPTASIGVNNGGGTLLGLAAWDSGGSSVAGHTHTGGVALSGNHDHGVTESSVGSGTAFDVRQPSFAVNRLIYT